MAHLPKPSCPLSAQQLCQQPSYGMCWQGERSRKSQAGGAADKQLLRVSDRSQGAVEPNSLLPKSPRGHRFRSLALPT